MPLTQRIVNTTEFEHSTNDNPQGVTFVNLPSDWDSWDEPDQTDWRQRQVQAVIPDGQRYAEELVDTDSGDYDAELAASPPVDGVA